MSGLKKQREGQQAHPSCEDFSMGEGASRCLADISHTPFIQSSPSLHRQGERGTEGRRDANVPRRHGKAQVELESLSSQPDDPAWYMLQLLRLRLNDRCQLPRINRPTAPDTHLPMPGLGPLMWAGLCYPQHSLPGLVWSYKDLPPATQKQLPSSTASDTCAPRENIKSAIL